jgi:hypothetical protein
MSGFKRKPSYFNLTASTQATRNYSQLELPDRPSKLPEIIIQVASYKNFSIIHKTLARLLKTVRDARPKDNRKTFALENLLPLSSGT